MVTLIEHLNKESGERIARSWDNGTNCSIKAWNVPQVLRIDENCFFPDIKRLSINSPVFVEDWKSFPNLKILNISWSPLNTTITDLENLKILNDESKYCVQSALFRMSTLTHLRVYRRPGIPCPVVNVDGFPPVHNRFGERDSFEEILPDLDMVHLPLIEELKLKHILFGKNTSRQEGSSTGREIQMYNLTQCPNLKILFLEACDLHTFTSDTIPPFVEWIMMRGNSFADWNLFYSLSSLSSLSSLDIRDNQFTTLPDINQFISPSLKRLQIDGNPVSRGSPELTITC